MTKQEKEQIANNFPWSCVGIVNGKKVQGHITGKRLPFPVFVHRDTHFEISWALAKRCIEKAVIIK